MRPSATDRYARGIERVIAHLQAAIVRGDPVPDLVELADVAHLSAFHFHRVYRAMAGEAVGHTVARLRLAQAIRLLAAGQSVTAAALAVGYESPQALARRFRAHLDVTPASLRGDAQAASVYLARLASPPPTGAPAVLRVALRQVAPFEVVVLRRQGAFEDLDAGFGALFEWALQAGVAERLQRLIGIPLSDHRDVPAQAHVFECAMGFGDAALAPPPGWPLRTLGGGLHAVLHHVGPYEEIEDAVDALLADWLPASGHVLRDQPLFHHYLDDPEQVPAAILRAEVHLPVE